MSVSENSDVNALTKLLEREQALYRRDMQFASRMSSESLSASQSKRRVKMGLLVRLIGRLS